MRDSFSKIYRNLYRQLRAQLLQSVIPKSQKKLPYDRKVRVEVIGFFHSISGIGESARLCARQLADDGYAVRCTSVEHLFFKPREIDWQWQDGASSDEIDCRIYHLNPPMLPPVILRMGRRNFKKTFNIGYWAWELERIPQEWIRAIRYMNAIITPSSFTTNVIKHYADYPVLTATHPVIRGVAATGIREKLRIPESAFLISNIFSFGSAMERKNPVGLVAAFNKAFQNSDEAYLVLKANTGQDSPEKQALLGAIAKNSKIILIDKHWSRADISGLIHCSDLYASLHRSEGFGLTIAEAMLLDTPALVTGWSGNMDFCTEENSFLIPYTPIKVNSTHPEFQGFDDATWADADIQQTAKVLKDLYFNRQLIAQKKSCCAQQMQKCINANKYQYALQALCDRQSAIAPALPA